MNPKQTKDDVKPRITTKEGEEVKPPAVRGDETDKPQTGGDAQRDTRPNQPTRDDGDNDDLGELK